MMFMMMFVTVIVLVMVWSMIVFVTHLGGRLCGGRHDDNKALQFREDGCSSGMRFSCTLPSFTYLL